MLFHTVRSSVLICLAALLLAGCGSGSNNDPIAPNPPDPVATQEILVSPSLGRINRGVARAFAANGNRIADDVVIGDDGTVTIEIPEDHTGPVIIEIEGADDADYFDEEASSTLPFPAGQTMRAALPAPRAEAGVSILTELAVRLAEASGEDIDAELVELANERIRAALAEDVEDLLTPPVIVGSDTSADDLDDDDAGRLAVRLGALAMLAEGDASPALTVLQQLATDAADGNIDGLAGEDAIEGLVYNPATFAADFAQAIRDFADAFGTEALKTRAAAAAPKTAIGRAVAPGATQPGTVNAAFTGDYLLTYFEAREGGPYMEGETVAVLIDAEAGTLQLGGTLTLSDPFQRFLGGDLITTEINWQDPETGFEYALSFNDTGVFNEINVGDANQLQDNGLPLFLGQLFDDNVDDSALALLTQYAGTYEVACTAVEPTGRSMATRDHARGTIIIGDDGAVDFDTGISFSAADVNMLFDRTTIDGDSRRVQVNYDENDGGRRLDIYLDSELEVTEIRYQDGQGGRTRAAIGSDANCDDTPADGLGDTDGATALSDGERLTHTGFVELTSNSPGSFSFWARDTSFSSSPGWGVTALLVEGPQECDGEEVLLFSSHGAFHSAESCTIELSVIPEDVDTDPIAGTFSGVFTTGGGFTVTEGVFQKQ